MPQKAKTSSHRVAFHLTNMVLVLLMVSIATGCTTLGSGSSRAQNEREAEQYLMSPNAAAVERYVDSLGMTEEQLERDNGPVSTATYQKLETHLRTISWAELESYYDVQSLTSFISRYPDFQPAQAEFYSTVDSYAQDDELQALGTIARYVNGVDWATEYVNQSIEEIEEEQRAEEAARQQRLAEEAEQQRLEEEAERARNARIAEENREWENVVENPSIENLETYVSSYPESQHIEDARVMLVRERWKLSDEGRQRISMIPEDWKDREIMLRRGVSDLNGMTIEELFSRPFAIDVTEPRPEGEVELEEFDFGSSEGRVELSVSNATEEFGLDLRFVKTSRSATVLEEILMTGPGAFDRDRYTEFQEKLQVFVMVTQYFY